MRRSARRQVFWKKGIFPAKIPFPFFGLFCYGECMAGRKNLHPRAGRAASVPSAGFGIPVSGVCRDDEAGRGSLSRSRGCGGGDFARRRGYSRPCGTPRCCRLPAGTVWPPDRGRGAGRGAWRRLASRKSIVSIFCRRRSKAMCHAASVLKVRPKGLLIDGNQTIPRAAVPAACGVLDIVPAARNPLWTATRWSRSLFRRRPSS